MTSTRWAVAAIALAACVIVVLGSCGKGQPAPDSPQALYVDLGCAKCHGGDRKGLRSGPPLENLAERWQEDELVAYMRDPASFVESNPRLSYLDEQYPIAMPAYPNTPETELRAVVQLIMGG